MHVVYLTHSIIIPFFMQNDDHGIRSSTFTTVHQTAYWPGRGGGQCLFFRFGGLNYLLLHGNKSRYFEMLIFLTFRRSLRSLN